MTRAPVPSASGVAGLASTTLADMAVAMADDAGRAGNPQKIRVAASPATPDADSRLPLSFDQQRFSQSLHIVEARERRGGA